MSSASEVLGVKSFLKQQFIVTSTDWVEACIDFIKQEHNQNLSLQSLKNLVYQQWLTADLEEIGVSALPTDLPSTQKTTLNSNYVLQVDGIRDISKPAYSQLKELERDFNSNAEFSAAPETTLAPWEAKPTRMLMLNLTDGCIRVQGMEYKTINSLSPNLPPGVKVQILGPVDCRFGVLMLTSENIKVLGGEVESKLTRFSRTTILRELLQLPSLSGSELNSEVISEEPISSTDISISSSRSTMPISNHSHTDSNTFSNWSSNTTQEIGTNIAITRPQNVSNSRNQRAGNHIANSFQNPPPQSSNSFPQQQNTLLGNQNENSVAGDLDAFEIEEDDFEQGLDYTVLDEIEKETLNQSKSFEADNEMQDVWLEDEDVVQEMLAFQDEDPGFHMPFEEPVEESNNELSHSPGIDKNKPFSYLSSVLENPRSNSTVTIKGFIITVLSKLECTMDKGWSLMVKINDGTASLDVNVHDKVIEGIIGISAPSMMKMQQAADTPEKRKEIMQAIAKFKATLQDYNCLMDVKFSPDSQPCLVKCYPLSQLHAQQLLERVKAYS